MRGIVYGLTITDAQNKLKEIIEDYVRYNIPTSSHQHKSSGDRVVFVNGDIWEATIPHEGCRGKKCNVAYIDHRIDVELLDMIIMPSVTAPPFQAWHRF